MPDRPIVDTVAYARVSTEQQAGEQRTSLPEQHRATTELAARLGRTLDARAVFVDAGVSGATAEGRPAFMELIAYCQAHPRPASAQGYVLVLNDSRFGRFVDRREAGHWQFILSKLGWSVRFAEGDDMEDGVGRDVVRLIGASQATEYRANLVRTARRAARATAQEGRWQNRAPFGYRRLATRADGSQRVLEAGQRKAADEVVRLTPGPEHEQEIIRTIFTAYASGLRTLGGLSAYLAARYPGRHWSRGVVHAILTNPVYAGDVVWCRRPHDATERKDTPVRDRSQWVVVADAHPAIVSRALVAAARARLETNRVDKRMTVGGYPLSGLIHCAACGEPFVGGGGRKGPAGDVDRYRFYRDRGGIPRRPGLTPPCTHGIATLRKRWVEEVVVREIARVTSHAGVQRVIAEALDAALDAAQGGHAGHRATLEGDLADLRRRRTRVVEAISGGVLQAREAAATLAELRRTIEQTEAALERSRFAVRRAAGMHELRDRLLTLATDFETQARRAVGPALRELVRPWLAGATLDYPTRLLTLNIRRVPAVLGMEMPIMLAQAGRKHTGRLTVVRRIAVPDSPQVAARRKAAGGYR